MSHSTLYAKLPLLAMLCLGQGSAAFAQGALPAEEAYMLIREGKGAEAQQVMAGALASAPTSPLLLLLQGYAQLVLAQPAQAQASFDKVLTQVPAKSPIERDYRLLLADAALSNGQEHRVEDLLRPLLANPDSNTDEQLHWRLRAARAWLWGGDIASLRRPQDQVPALNLHCLSGANARQCQPSPIAVSDPAYQLAAKAYDLLAAGKPAAAAGVARLAQRMDPANASYPALVLDALIQAQQFPMALQVADLALDKHPANAALLTRRGDIRARLGQPEPAQADYAAALATGKVAPTQQAALRALIGQLNVTTAAAPPRTPQPAPPSDLDQAYRAIQSGDDARAAQLFARADKQAPLKVNPLKDAAYASMRLGEDQQAQAYLVRAADDTLRKPVAERSAEDTQSLAGVRSTMAGLTRELGALASVSYRNAALGRGDTNTAAATNNLQLGAEVYWRPLGQRNGRPLEFYARAFETAYSRNGDVTGRDSVQATFGVRYKPLTDHNLLFSLGRVIPGSANSARDTLAQAAYSWGEGGELRSSHKPWFTQQYYAELGRYTHLRQTYASANARLGMSYLLDSLSPNLVAFPHVVLADDYNSGYAKPNAAGIGPGLQLRYWYRQDAYNAHRSYVDFTLQVRTRLGGDEQRARGTFFTVLTSY